MELEAAVGRGKSKSGDVTNSGLGVRTRKITFDGHNKQLLHAVDASNSSLPNGVAAAITFSDTFVWELSQRSQIDHKNDRSL